MTPKDKVDQRTRIERKNQEFEGWLQENPGKKFSDFYVAKVSANLERGNPHPTIGGNLTGGVGFNDAGKYLFDTMLARGLEPEQVCVDYGCGSLRVGQHLMQFLEPGHYWGLDITDHFYNEGLRLLDDDIVARCKPNLRVIDEQTVEEVAASRPDFLIARGVLIHVPPSEWNEFWDRIMTCITDNTQTLIRVQCSDETVQYSGRSWSHPKSMIEAAVAERGGRCLFEDERKEHNHRLDYEVRVYDLNITRS